MMANVRKAQRQALRQGRKRRQSPKKKGDAKKKAAVQDPRQTKLIRFGIGAVRHSEQQQVSE
jgi:hypothetical protein